MRGSMSTHSELNTIASTLTDVATRITAIVESEGDKLPAEVYTELVAAERSVGALLRRVVRVANKVR